MSVKVKWWVMKMISFVRFITQQSSAQTHVNIKVMRPGREMWLFYFLSTIIRTAPYLLV